MCTECKSERGTNVAGLFVRLDDMIQSPLKTWNRIWSFSLGNIEIGGFKRYDRLYCIIVLLIVLLETFAVPCSGTN